MLRPCGLRHQRCLSKAFWQFRLLDGVNQRSTSTSTSKQHEEVHNISPKIDKLDNYLEGIAKTIAKHRLTSIHDLYQQYQNEAGNVIDRVVPYEERPHAMKRADADSSALTDSNDLEGDGLVLVVHAQLDSTRSRLEKTTVCSGFVVRADITHGSQGDTVITCAHTLEEVNSHHFMLSFLIHDRLLLISLTPLDLPAPPKKLLFCRNPSAILLLHRLSKWSPTSRHKTSLFYATFRRHSTGNTSEHFLLNYQAAPSSATYSFPCIPRHQDSHASLRLTRST